MNPQLNFMLSQAIQAFQAGNFSVAEQTLKRVLQVQKDNFPALNILGLIKASQEDYSEAVIFLKRAASINPNESGLQYNLAKVLSSIGNELEAVKHHQKAVNLAPANADAWVNYGKSLAALGRHLDALNAFNKSIQLAPSYLSALLNKGAVLNELARYEEAIDCANLVLSIKSDSAEALSNKGSAFKGLKKYDEAVLCYESSLALVSNSPDTWFNKGNALCELRKFREALIAYDHALELSPSFVDAWFNKANAFCEIKHYDDCLVCCDHAISLNQSFSDAFALKGVVYFQQKNYSAAAEVLKVALELSPEIDYALGSLIDAKLLSGDWAGRNEQINQMIAKIIEGKRAVRPFQFLAMVDSPDLQMKVAQAAVRHQFPENQALSEIKKTKHDRIRVAYFSGDFKNHAVSILTAELFELHNRKDFEIYAFSFQDAIPGDLMRERLIGAFDHFLNVGDKSDLEIARLARELEIDIAVDLGGLTQDSRPGVFALRSAPIQINYLGYPGTTGAEYMDYIIGDEVLIPSEARKAYSEKVVYMPDCFQVNDSKRAISQKIFTREECGIPKDTFVYCSFNNLYKITPEMFAIWMRILKRSEDTCLWLLDPGEAAKENFQLQAEAIGVNPARIFFAGRVSPDEYLARYRIADLFLDTLPFNAGTTASDALWAGLPILTCAGSSFAGRMAASLLTAARLPELITNSLGEYEQRAIDFSKNAVELLKIRENLSANRLQIPLFDTHRFVDNLENAFQTMYQRYQNEQAPDHLFISK